METKHQAIKRLKQEGFKTLYVVDCYVTDRSHLVSTWLWNIYATREDALRWIELCKRFHSSQEWYWEFYDWTHLDKTKGYEASYFYNDGHVEMIERFKLTVVQ